MISTCTCSTIHNHLWNIYISVEYENNSYVGQGSETATATKAGCVKNLALLKNETEKAFEQCKV